MQLILEENGFSVYYHCSSNKYSVYKTGGELVGNSSNKDFVLNYVKTNKA